LKLLRDEGVIAPSERVVCILTGHALKDPDATVSYHTGLDTKAAKLSEPTPPFGLHANQPIRVADDFEAIRRAIEVHTSA
jgi:threonine synthase